MGSTRGSALVFRLIACCLAALIPQWTVADEPTELHPDLILSRVVEVSSSGRITVASGEQFTLWPLTPTNPTAYSDFLTDRLIYCLKITEGEADCYVYDKPFGRHAALARVWLPEFGLARVECMDGGFAISDMSMSMQGYPGWGGNAECFDGIAQGPGQSSQAVPSERELRMLIALRWQRQKAQSGLD